MSACFFSIIIPVYNSEKYLPTALESIRKQDFTDYEVLIVEGGSDDRSREICLSAAGADDRIQVLEQAGRLRAGEARNLALEKAGGEYILFVDSDDYLEADALRAIRSALQDDDVLCFGNRRVFFNRKGQQTKQADYPGHAFAASDKEAIGRAFLDLSKDKTFPFLWNKAFRRELLRENAIRFSDYPVTEDFFFNMQVFEAARNVRGIEPILYNYRKPAETTLVSSYQESFFDVSKEKYLAEMRFLKDRGLDTEENRQVFYDSHVRHLLSAMIKNLVLDKEEQIRKIETMLSDPETGDVLAKIRPSGRAIRAVVATFRSGSASKCRRLARLARRLGF